VGHVTVDIDDQIAERVRALAHDDDLAKVVAQALEQWLAEAARESAGCGTEGGPSPDEEASRQRAYEALLGIGGIWDVPGDAADRHDDYIYGQEKQ